MKKLNIYNLKGEFITSINTKNIYEDTFYHRLMPTIGAKTCKKILNIVSPHFKIEKELFVLEWDENKYKGTQNIYRSGTILNF